MSRTTPFKVALIARERDNTPSWVVDRLAAIPGLEVIYGHCDTEDKLLANAGDADMIWTMARTPVLTPDVLPKLTRCKAILRSGSGMDGYPVEEASQLGIHMCNCPESISEAVAEHAVALLFALIRQIPFKDNAMRGLAGSVKGGGFRWHISGRTLGLVGFGRIGRRVTEMMAGFRMNVLVFDPYTNQDNIRQAGAKPTDLDELLAQSDYVSLHCPLTETTRHLINAEKLALMKPDALLINTSRGGVVDEAALVAALREGRLGGAGLDVTDPEPPVPGSPLFSLDNVILTPHCAAASADFERNFWECSIQVVLECMQGDYLSHCMNRQQLVNPRA
ncbi:MAG: C-terminal binding protein [Lentisphaerae bacterium]|nr:C-terminal binding protein [Lentisphaerota bacterium]